jgi:hypothetical protein
MTTYIVTTGVSLALSRCWKPRDGSDSSLGLWDGVTGLSEILAQPERASILEAIQKLAKSVIDEMGEEERRYRELALEIVDRRFRWECWQPRSPEIRSHLLPAELATLCFLAHRFRAGDVLEITCGRGEPGTPDNLREAALIWAVLHKLELRGELAARAELSPPFSWAPETTERFLSGMDDLWQYATREGAAADLRFVLTGGYKAVLLDIMRRLVAGQRSSSIHYLHEGGSNLVTIEIEAGKIKGVGPDDSF